ncbi:dipeptidase [Anatilimnocola floriformis]|uniref:dipeptidase n=1 Tax=Anatilimnocola floriformis TaxID=2948575 RepID=UPI0020C3A000|nr:dipeptidase [Anatilimnocola floriformis]
MEDIRKYLDAERGTFERDLCQLLAIPSVAADSKYHPDVRRAADWVAGQFQAMGLKTEKIETIGQPLIYAESPAIPGAPTVLVYGHYDVQPADPLNEWVTPPFEPTIRNGNVYARGATDDKGQMLTHVLSTRAWLKTRGKLPVQLKFVIEGEEEVGSKGIYDYLKQPGVTDKLKSDIVVISDTSQFAPGQPAITYGLRGIAYFEIRLTGPKQDLHSGTFGGAVTNPLNALASLLHALRDANGRVQVPGFYDDVLALSDRERKQFAALPFSDESFKEQLGVAGLYGEKDFSTLERRWARPTFDVHGLWGGYQGEGGKTVLPAKAGAKFSFRLVPNQDPKKIAASLETFLKERLPPGITMELIYMSGAQGCVVPLESPFMAAAEQAIETGFGKRPVFIREGGSIPIVTNFKQQLGVDTLLLGWGLDDDNTHSPNEKFNLGDFHRGICASAALWEEIAKIKR